MDWITLLVTLVPALVHASTKVIEEVVAKPLMEPAQEQFRKRVLRGYKAKAGDTKLHRAIATALEGFAEIVDTDLHFTLKRALHRLTESGERREAQREAVAAAALAMTAEDPVQIPVTLLTALDLDVAYRPILARLLWAFRTALAESDADFRELAAFVRDDAGYARLLEIAAGIESLSSTVERRTGGAAIRALLVKPEDREIEADYLQALLDECGYVPLTGRDPHASSTSGLSMRLEQVYVALNTTERQPETRKGRRDVPEERDTGTFSALRVLLDNRHLLLLGEPGSGKSTFADHLALCLAGERKFPDAEWGAKLVAHDAAWEDTAPLPIRVRLREFAADTECLPVNDNIRGQAQHLLDYIVKMLRAGFYDDALPLHAVKCLMRGDALLILDGLDEVGDPHRRTQVSQAIADLEKRRCSRSRLLVTCRVRQYPLDTAGRPLAKWALPGFHVATLADFDREQINNFVTVWFAELHTLKRFSATVRDQKVKSLQTALGARADLQDIAPRPIILTQMVLVHDIEGELPATRVKLYAACAELLLWKWEQLRAQQAGQQLAPEDFFREVLKVSDLQKENVERALDHAVYDAHAAQGATDDGAANIPEEILREQVTACLMRAGLQEHDAVGKAQLFINVYLRGCNGLIVPAGEHTFQTPHRTFQEFMAARWLQWPRSFRRDAVRLVRDNYDLWREVFLLAVGQTNLFDAVDAVGKLCPVSWTAESLGWRRTILAGQGLGEIGLTTVREDEEFGLEVEARVKRHLVRTMQDTNLDNKPNNPSVVPVPTRYAAAETLDRLGWLPEDLDSWVWIGEPDGEGVAGKGFWMAKYPVTNHQFARFVDAGGYGERQWWSDEGWAWRSGEPRYDWQRTDCPDYWDDPRFGKTRQGYPVVGISWYEAQAYCAWLNKQIADGKLQMTLTSGEWRLLESESKIQDRKLKITVRLPMDEEWIAAAGGAEDDRYPWGVEWDASRANTRESSLGGTSPVGMYPSGQSRPAGVWDMAGNVWEWLESDDGGQSAFLRGGAWYYNLNLARVTSRDRGDAGSSVNGVGMRLVLSPNSPDF